jgi:ssDNA-binding Zn-finger/Zn-ribbon topoisomerase 1
MLLKEQIKASLQQSKKDMAADDANTTSSAVPVCPLCGAAMVLRTAKTGINAGKQFYGCSNYPKCHGIVNIRI